MRRNPIYTWIGRCTKWLPLAGGTMFGFSSGCDDNVQISLVAGLNDFANALVDTFFLTITPDEAAPVAHAITHALTTLLT